MNPITIVAMIVISYFILTIFPSLMYYYYGIYYVKYGFNVGKDPAGEVKFILFSGYYCIMFYLKKEKWFEKRKEVLKKREEMN